MLFDVKMTDRLIGAVIKKEFRKGWFYGEVMSENEGLYFIKYDDGDEEEMTAEQVDELIGKPEDEYYRENAYLNITKWYN